MHRHMDLYVRPGTRARDFAGFSRWRVSMLLKMEMKVCHWVNGALFFVLLTFSSYWFRLTVPLCSVSTDALAPDTNRYLFARVFHLAPHPTPPPPPSSLPSFSFSFSFPSSSYSSYTSKETILLSGWKRRSNSLRVEIMDQWGKGGNIKSTASEISGELIHSTSHCSTIFSNVNFVQLIFLHN